MNAYALEEDTVADSMPSLAKSIMIKGLFSSLHYPYAHFVCSTVSGDLLFTPVWEAAYRLERMGLKV